MNPFIYLALAIVAEIVATNMMKASDGFTKIIPTIVTTISYIISFSLFTLSLKEIPLGTAYAIWAGIGTAGTVAVGVLFWREQFTLWHLLGVVLIIAGVMVLNLFTTSHA